MKLFLLFAFALIVFSSEPAPTKSRLVEALKDGLHSKIENLVTELGIVWKKESVENAEIYCDSITEAISKAGKIKDFTSNPTNLNNLNCLKSAISYSLKYLRVYKLPVDYFYVLLAIMKRFKQDISLVASSPGSSSMLSTMLNEFSSALYFQNELLIKNGLPCKQTSFTLIGVPALKRCLSMDALIDVSLELFKEETVIEGFRMPSPPQDFLQTH